MPLHPVAKVRRFTQLCYPLLAAALLWSAGCTGNPPPSGDAGCAGPRCVQASDCPQLTCQCTALGGAYDGGSQQPTQVTKQIPGECTDGCCGSACPPSCG